ADLLADTLTPDAGRAELAAPGPQPAGKQMQRIFLSKADGTVHRMGNACSRARRLGATDLRSRDGQPRKCGIGLSKGSLGSDVRGCRLFGKYRKLLLDGLKCADWPPKLRTLGGVAGCHVQQRMQGTCDLRRAQHRATQKQHIARQLARQRSASQYMSIVEMQGVARLARDVQAQCLAGRAGYRQQHDAGRLASRIGYSDQRLDMTTPRHVPHGAVYHPSIQTQLRIG